LGRLPDIRIRTPCKAFFPDGLDVHACEHGVQPRFVGADSHRVSLSLNSRNGWYGQILFSRCSRECNCSLDILRGKAGKVSQDRLGCIAGRETSKHGAQRNPRSLKDRFSSADLWVTNKTLVEMHEITAAATHYLFPRLQLILAPAVPAQLTLVNCGELLRNVVATSLNVSQSLTASSGLVLIDGDIGKQETAAKTVEAAITQFGTIDVLVNNAGIFRTKPFTEFTTEDFNALVSTNLLGFLYITQLAVKQMLKQKSGNVVSITAALVDQPVLEPSPYQDGRARVRTNQSLSKYSPGTSSSGTSCVWTSRS
jgi:hypothetical protein